MSLSQYRYVIAVAETRHFHKAADQCYISQPTLSMQIKKLEDDLGKAHKRVSELDKHHWIATWHKDKMYKEYIATNSSEKGPFPPLLARMSQICIPDWLQEKEERHKGCADITWQLGVNRLNRCRCLKTYIMPDKGQLGVDRSGHFNKNRHSLKENTTGQERRRSDKPIVELDTDVFLAPRERVVLPNRQNHVVTG